MAQNSIEFHHRNLPLLLLRARERVISRFRPILNAHGITEQQWRVVRVLLDVTALEPREIGELCSISSPSLVGVLSRMEQLGFVKRQRVEHDQRRVRVSVTARARALAARMAPKIDATYLQIHELVGAGFIDRLETLVDQLLEALPPSDEDTADTPATDPISRVFPAGTAAKRIVR
jgi:homoprotocatechuate degradation regulator HpaR